MTYCCMHCLCKICAGHDKMQMWDFLWLQKEPHIQRLQPIVSPYFCKRFFFPKNILNLCFIFSYFDKLDLSYFLIKERKVGLKENYILEILELFPNMSQKPLSNISFNPYKFWKSPLCLLIYIIVRGYEDIHDFLEVSNHNSYWWLMGLCNITPSGRKVTRL